MEDHRSSLSTKMSQEYSAPRIMRSDAFSPLLSGKKSRSNRQGEDGRTVVMCLDPKERLSGEYSMLNTQEWPNDAAVCLLSQVLEPSVSSKYFLSAKACAGILRRAEKRGKALPTMLLDALRVVAAGSNEGGDSRGQDPVVACYGGNNLAGPIDVATARNACKSPTGRLDFESETFVVQPATTQYGSVAGRLAARPASRPCADR